MQKRHHIILSFILTTIMVWPFLLAAQEKYQLDSVVGRWSHYDMRIQVAWQEYNAINKFLIAQNEVRGEGTDRDEGARHTTQYDGRGNELEQVYSYWNAAKGEWVEREKRVRTYDDSNRMLSYAEYEMRGGKWVGLARTVQNFQDKVSTTMEYSGQGEHWVPTYKNVGLLNENNDDVLRINYQWDSVAGDWAYWMKHENTFLRDTLLSESATYTWKNGGWVNQEKVVYKYRPDMNKVSDRVIYTGTADGWQFKYLTQMRYYDAVEREENFYWSEKEGVWRAETFKESYIDRQGRVTDFVLFVWDVELEEYRRSVQGMTVYDEKDRVTHVQEVRYEGGKVNYGMEMQYDFDKDGNLYREARRSLVPGEGWVVQEAREFTFNKDMVSRDGKGEVYVFDWGRIGHENSTKNKHAIDSIRSYRYLDGEMELQEETKYYYSKMQEPK